MFIIFAILFSVVVKR